MRKEATDQLLEILRNEVELGNANNSKDLYQLLREELVLSLSEVAPATPEEMLAPAGHAPGREEIDQHHLAREFVPREAGLVAEAR